MAPRSTCLSTALVLLLASSVAAALADDPPVVPPASQPAPATPEPSWFTPPEGLACRQWTDGCHLCIRHEPDAKAECSTPSIACVQTTSRCLDPPGPPQQGAE